MVVLFDRNFSFPVPCIVLVSSCNRVHYPHSVLLIKLIMEKQSHVTFLFEFHVKRDSSASDGKYTAVFLLRYIF